VIEEPTSSTQARQELTRREHHAVASILENERLTADLDDASAKLLLDWGIACVQRVVRSTAGLSDEQAEQAMYPRLRATRRLMRWVNQWIAGRREPDAQRGAAALDQLVEQAAVIYGEGYAPPSQDRRQRFLSMQFEYADDPGRLIADLRRLIESPSETANPGARDDQEKNNAEIHY